MLRTSSFILCLLEAGTIQNSRTWEDPCCPKSLIRGCCVTTKAGPGLRPSCSRLFCLLPQALQLHSFSCPGYVTPSSHSDSTFLLASSPLPFSSCLRSEAFPPFPDLPALRGHRSPCSESHCVRPGRWEKQIYCCFDAAADPGKSGVAGGTPCLGWCAPRPAQLQEAAPGLCGAQGADSLSEDPVGGLEGDA